VRKYLEINIKERLAQFDEGREGDRGIRNERSYLIKGCVRVNEGEGGELGERDSKNLDYLTF